MKIYVQIFGVFALVFWCISIQMNKRKKVLILQTLANIFYSAQYFFLGAVSTAGMNLISTIRTLIFYRNDKKKKTNSIFSLMLFITLILTIWCIDIILNGFKYYEIIPVFITIAYTYATWQQNLHVLRYIFLVCAFLWIGFNLKVGAYVLVIGNVLEIISGITAISRFDIKKKNRKKINNEPD